MIVSSFIIQANVITIVNYNHHLFIVQATSLFKQILTSGLFKQILTSGLFKQILYHQSILNRSSFWSF